jgi:murein L,D-transpeptidase YcbB/YkuD
MDMTAAERAARIRLALARWRELPVALGEEYVHVNIPEYRLEMIRDGARELEMRVVVGSTNDPTPAFNDEIEYLVFNPYWHVPRRIALEELVPKAAGSAGYLTKQNYEVLQDGQLVEEASINWADMNAAKFDYRIRQRPGPGNALGEVKFLFPNPMNIYLHDSPARSLYAHSMRAFSHGCIRLEDPMALAAALLEGRDNWDSRSIDGIIDKGNRRQINLDQPVPVYLTYITARVTDSGELALYRDIYDRDASVLARYL